MSSKKNYNSYFSCQSNIQRAGRLRYLGRPSRTPTSRQKWGEGARSTRYHTMDFQESFDSLIQSKIERLLRAATNLPLFVLFNVQYNYNRTGDSGDLQCRSIPHVYMGTHAMGTHSSSRCHHGILLHCHHHPLSISTRPFIRLMMLFFLYLKCNQPLVL